MKIDKSIISLFILALLIPFINKAYVYFPDFTVDLFIFTDYSQALSYYIYDTSSSLIIILLSLYIYNNSIHFYIRKTSLVIGIYFILDIFAYILYRESVSTMGLKLPFIPHDFGLFHIYLLDVITHFVYYFFIKSKDHGLGSNN